MSRKLSLLLVFALTMAPIAPVQTMTGCAKNEALILKEENAQLRADLQREQERAARLAMLLDRGIGNLEDVRARLASALRKIDTLERMIMELD